MSPKSILSAGIERYRTQVMKVLLLREFSLILSGFSVFFWGCYFDLFQDLDIFQFVGGITDYVII